MTPLWPTSGTDPCSCIDGYAFFFGADSFVYTIEDSKGAQAQALVQVNVQYTQPPDVSISSPTNNQILAFDQATVPVSVLAQTDSSSGRSIAKLELFADGQKITEALNPTPYPALTTFNWSHVSCDTHYLQAKATDSAGDIGFSLPISLTKTNKPGNHLPVPVIANLQPHLRAGGSAFPDPAAQYELPVIEARTNVTGSVTDADPGDSVSYQFWLYLPDGTPLGSLTPEISGTVVSNTPPSSLANLDFSRFQDGVYELELRAWDGYDSSSARVSFRLHNQLQIGRLTFSQNDLGLPGNGLPLSILRTYDSYNPNSADFGYGWSFSLGDLNVQINEDRMNFEDQFADDTSGDTFSLRTGGGRDVTLTLPDGRRTTFTYRLQMGNYGGDGVSAYWAVWDPEPGVTATLTTLNPGTPGQDSPGDNTLVPYPWWYWANSDVSVAIENYDFPGFKLTLQDGTIYEITREDLGIRSAELDPGHFIYPHPYGKPRLSRIILRDRSQILFGADTITKVLPDTTKIHAVVFQRDGQGRIVKIFDPSGLDAQGAPAGKPALKYDYEAGNLKHVSRSTDRNTGSYDTTTFDYTNTAFPHFITGITDPRGVPVARSYFEPDGRLSFMADANGKETHFTHTTDSNTEVIIDRMGRTNSYVYDLRGNVIWQTNALGIVTRTAYDDQNHELAVTNYGTPFDTWTTNAYDQNGFLARTVDALHTNLFCYDARGDLLLQTDSLGNTTSNRYDGNGNVTNVVHLDPTNGIVEQTFSVYENSRLVMVLDGNAHTNATYGYDGVGNMTTSTDARNFTHTYGYDANGNQTSSSYDWTPPGGGSPVTVSATTDYDAAGRAVHTVAGDGAEAFTFYNSLGKVDYTIDKLGNTNSFLYDAQGNLIQTTYPDGLVTRTVYSDDGKPVLTSDRNQVTGTLTEYDDLGRVTDTIRLKDVRIDLEDDPDGPPHTVIGSLGTALSTNSTEYFDNGWVKSRTGPDRKTTTYLYYADGQTQSVTDPLNHVTQYEYDPAGRQSRVLDARQHNTWFGYDPLGRLMATTFHDATYTSNVFNNVGQKVGQSDQASVFTAYTYDLAGQLTAVTNAPVADPLNPNQFVNPVTKYDYDDYGRLAVTHDANGYCTTNLYDQFGRQVGRTLPGGQGETSQYDDKGRLSWKFDFKGQATQLVYDRFGRTRAKFYFEAGETGTPAEGVAYHYNQLGQLWQIIELRGGAVTTDPTDGYPNLVASAPAGPGGRLLASLKQVPADTAGVFTGLALLGVAMVFMPRDMRRHLLALLRRSFALSPLVAPKHGEGGWDRAGGSGVSFFHLLSSIFHPRSSTQLPRRLHIPSFLWRAATYVLITALLFTDPRLDFWNLHAECVFPSNTSVENRRVTELAYDLEGRLAQVNSPEGVINYGYDLATGRHTSTCTLNSHVDYAYDDLGRLLTVSVSKRNGVSLSTPEVTIYGYDAVGNRSSAQLPNGVLTTYLYDSLNRLTNLTHTANGTLLASYSYQLHPTGRRTNAVEILRQEGGSGACLTNTLTWQYDAMYRLTNELSSCSLSDGRYTNFYAYDKVGNRVTKLRTVGSRTETTTSVFNANDQLLREEITALDATLSTNFYAYDDNGSLTSKTDPSGTVTYAYNLANKLSSVTANGSTTSFLYNDQGIRVRSWRQGDQNPTMYLVDANNHTGYAQVLEELSAFGDLPSISYTLGDDVLSQSRGTTLETLDTRQLLYDGHGSTRQLSNSAASVTSRYNYDAYGITQSTSTPTAETSLLYCGQQYDSALQMYNLRARYYNPANGRFNQRDTFAGNNFDPQSLHKYAYCQNDGINGVDPSGNFSSIELLVVIACIAILATELTVAIANPVSRARLLTAFFTHGYTGKKLVEHWTEGTGTPLQLTEDDMVDIGATSMVSGGSPTITEGDGFNNYLQHLSGGPVTITDMPLYLGAQQRATLGRFWGHVKGTLSGTPDNWTFAGSMWFHDVEKFDQSESGTWYRNAVCWAMSHGFSGKDYEVTSEEVQVKQNSSDGEIQWAGTGSWRKSPGNPERYNPDKD